MYSYIIKNATIVDGTGSAGFIGYVATEGDKIVEVGTNPKVKAKYTIDAQGLVVTPGFIDIQNHSDAYWQLFENPELTSLLTQGFTTAIVGNCGGSLAPILGKNALLSVQKWHPLGGSNINWTTFNEYAGYLSSKKLGINIGSLVGYSTLRRALVGDQVRSLDAQETAILQKALTDSMKAGAFGLSTGLSYSHEIIISELELYQLAKVVKANCGLLSIHLRNESEEILESIEEAIDIAMHTGANLKISHLKIRGSSNWKHFKDMVVLLEMARHRGINIKFDVYPYDSIWHPLYTYLPKWVIKGGRTAVISRIKDKETRKKILNHLQDSDSGFSEMVIASSSQSLHLEGKKVGSIAKSLGITSEEAVLEILEKAGEEILVFDKAMNYEQVTELLTHPLSLISTDGAGYDLTLEKQKNTLVHPRCFGSAPKFIKQSIAEKRISLETAINKLTGSVADTLGIRDRGKIAVNSLADLVVLNPRTIRDKASLNNPYRYSEGIVYVFVNGNPAIANGELTNSSSGRFLRKDS